MIKHTAIVYSRHFSVSNKAVCRNCHDIWDNKTNSSVENRTPDHCGYNQIIRRYLYNFTYLLWLWRYTTSIISWTHTEIRKPLCITLTFAKFTFTIAVTYFTVCRQTRFVVVFTVFSREVLVACTFTTAEMF